MNFTIKKQLTQNTCAKNTEGCSLPWNNDLNISVTEDEWNETFVNIFKVWNSVSKIFSPRDTE